MAQNVSKIIAITMISFALLTLLMLSSGDHKAVAFTENELKVLNNAKVNVVRAIVQSDYTKQQLVYGQVQAAQQTLIGFERNGIVAKLNVENGSKVEKGELLASLDTARIRSQKQELEAELNKANAEAKLAELSQQRVRNLVQNKLESEQRLDEESARVDAAKAQVAAVQAKLLTLQVAFDKSMLFAPYSGQIISQFIDVGTPVSTGQGVFEIIDNGPLEVHLGLPKSTAFTLEPQQNIVLDIRGEKVSGTVKSISSNRTLRTRTIESVITLDLPDLVSQEGESQNIASQEIVPGDLASFSLMRSIDETGIWLPISSLANGIRGLWTVFVVDENDGILTSRLVSIEYSDGTHVYVKGALKENDLVVIDGTHRLTPEQTVSNVNIVNIELARVDK